jgi:predicted permease
MFQVAEHLLSDLRYSARRLRRAPGFVVVSTLLIAVSLASSTAIFGIADVLLLRTLPVRDPASLVQLFELRPAIPPQGMAPVELRELVAAESSTLTDVMGKFSATASLEGETTTSTVNVDVVTPSYFEGLGVAAILGRTLGVEDEVTAERTAVLSHSAWTRLFAADPSAVGRSVRLAGQPYVIVGVLHQGFNGTSLDSRTDFHVPYVHVRDFNATFPYVEILARIRAGESLASANAEVRTIWSRFREAFVAGGGVVGPMDRDLSVELRSIARGTSRVREQFQPTLLLLFGAAGLVLAMVCLNVGGLLLARIAQARRDAAMRRALGASRARIAIQWTVESLLVAAIGGVAGLALVAGALPALVRWLAPLIGFGGFGRTATLDVPFDLRVAAFGAVAMLGTGILAALLPAFSSMRKDAYVTLKASIDDRETRRLQSGLSVVQIAISTVLLFAGGLTVHSLDRLDDVDAGFDRELLVRFAFDSRLADYDGPATAAFQRRLIEETTQLPGVEAAAITNTPAMQGIGAVMTLTPPGGPPEIDSAWNTTVNNVTEGYFATMGIELANGTLVDDDQQVSADGSIPVVVNAAFARRFFAGADAVGRVLDMGREFKTPRYRIVGVVEDANYRSLREANPPILYANPLSSREQFPGTFSLLVRTRSPDAAIEPVRALVRSIDEALPVLEAVTMSAEVDRSLWRERLAATLTSAFAIIGVATAAIGLYAILANYVASRRKEIGLRIALGAMVGDVLRLVARRVTPIVLVGLILGLAMHLALSRWLESLLYEISTLDPVTVVTTSLALLAMSVAAALVPALHATSVDPAKTLRED